MQLLCFSQILLYTLCYNFAVTFSRIVWVSGILRYRMLRNDIVNIPATWRSRGKKRETSAQKWRSHPKMHRKIARYPRPNKEF